MIENNVLKTIDQNNMISQGDRILVAVSGGFDSTMLLHILNKIKSKLNIELIVAHLNHNIRGSDAKKDEQYVIKLAEKMGLEYVVDEFDVPSFARKKKLSLEDAARRARYKFLEDAAEIKKANKIAVAHNADDNVETFIMRLIRGTGLKGLGSIPKVRGMIIRPLIDIWRKDIESYCREHRLNPRNDTTNFDTTFFRNKIRHQILPVLRKNNPEIKKALIRSMEAISRKYRLIRAETEKVAKKILKVSETTVEINKNKLLKIDPVLQSELLRLAIEKIRKSLVDISFINISDILKNAKKSSSEIHLSGINVRIGRRAITLSKNIEKIEEMEYKYVLPVPGRVKTKADCIIEASLYKKNIMKKIRFTDPNTAYINYKKVNGPIVVRSWRKGDKMRPLGLNGTKKVQDIFVDSKIDVKSKPLVPIISDRQKILWIAGYRIDDSVKVDSKTPNILKLSCKTVKK